MSEPGYKTTLERQQDAFLDFVNDFHLEIDEISLQCDVWAASGPEYVPFADDVRRIIRLWDEKRRND